MTFLQMNHKASRMIFLACSNNNFTKLSTIQMQKYKIKIDENATIFLVVQYFKMLDKHRRGT